MFWGLLCLCAGFLSVFVAGFVGFLGWFFARTQQQGDFVLLPIVLGACFGCEES